MHNSTMRNILVFPEGSNSPFPFSTFFPNDTIYFVSESGETQKNDVEPLTPRKLNSASSSVRGPRERVPLLETNDEMEAEETITSDIEGSLSAQSPTTTQIDKVVTLQASSSQVVTSQIDECVSTPTLNQNVKPLTNIGEKVVNTSREIPLSRTNAILKYISQNHLATLLHNINVFVINCTFLHPSNEDEFASIRYILKLMEKSQETNHPWKGKIILLSNTLSWGDSIDVDGDGIFSDLEAVCRIPIPFAENQYQIEKIVARLHSTFKQNIAAHIVFSGLWYGLGEFIFQGLFKQAREAKDFTSLPVYTSEKMPEGDNIIPTIHVNDLGVILQALVNYNKEAIVDDSISGNTITDAPPLYMFAVDQKLNSQKEIVRAIATTYGHISELTMIPASSPKCLLYEHLHHITVHLPCETNEWIKRLNVDWFSLSFGPVETVSQLRQEYEEKRQLEPLRLVILGPPYSGKSTSAEILSSFYNIPHLHIKNVLKEFFDQVTEIEEKLSELGVDPKIFLENQQQAKKKADTDEPLDQDPVIGNLKTQLIELITLQKDLKFSPDTKSKAKASKGKVTTKEEESSAPRYSDNVLVKAFKWKLNQIECKNHGWIMDGFPKTKDQVTELFCFPAPEIPIDPKTKKPKVIEQVEPRLANPELLPHYVLYLNVEDDRLLREHFTRMTNQDINQLSQNHVADQTNESSRYYRRLNFYNKHHKSHAVQFESTESEDSSEADDVYIAICNLRSKKEETADLPDSIENENADSTSLQMSSEGLPDNIPEIQCIKISLSQETEDSQMEISRSLKTICNEAYHALGTPHIFGHPPSLETLIDDAIHKIESNMRLSSPEQNDMNREEDSNQEEPVDEYDIHDSFIDDYVDHSEKIDTNSEYEAELAVLDATAEPLKDRFAHEILPAITKAILELCHTRPSNPLRELSEKLIAAGLDYE